MTSVRDLRLHGISSHEISVWIWVRDIMVKHQRLRLAMAVSSASWIIRVRECVTLSDQHLRLRQIALAAFTSVSLLAFAGMFPEEPAAGGDGQNAAAISTA